ncbi:unnamed protein product [Parajaminaea phylloscopi]
MDGTGPAGTTDTSVRKRPRKRTRKSRTRQHDQGDTTADATAHDNDEEDEGGDSLAEAARSTKFEATASSSSLVAPAPSKSSNLVGDQGQGGSNPVQVTSQTEPTSSATILTSNPHKPSVLPRPSIYGPRRYTLSVALPSSIVYNAQTMELKTRLVGSMARICAVFNVDEIIVFDDGTPPPQTSQQQGGNGQDDKGRKRDWNQHNGGEGGGGQGNKDSLDANSFMAMILQYLETPQYMRRTLFPMHPHLRLAGLLPPLDLPHHLRFEDESPFREGLVTEAPHWAGQPHPNGGGGASTAWVDVGHRGALQCRVDGGEVPPIGTRVTVKMPPGGRGNGSLVSPRTPVQSEGLYWGYSVRLVSRLSDVFTGLPFASEGGGVSDGSSPPEYDLVIGTAERGDALTDVLYATSVGSAVPSSKASKGGAGADLIQPLPQGFQHALVLFGGLSGLEVAVEADPAIPLGLEDARELCDFWVDVAEGQGSRTVRTEEALTITLARLKTAFEQLGRR